MSYTKRIVCLANSFKNAGTCVAGKESNGVWVRPISARPAAELSSAEARYDKGAPKLLDIMDVPLLETAAHLHQTENHLIDSGKSWVKLGELPVSKLLKLVDDPPSLWVNSGHSRVGKFDCVDEEEVDISAGSLLLIRVGQFSILKDPKPQEHVRPHRASFVYKGVSYNLKLTDPVAITLFDLDCIEPERLKDPMLCVSLTEPWKDGHCYKLVAGVFTDPPLR